MTRAALRVEEDAYTLSARDCSRRVALVESSELRIVEYPTYEGPTTVTPSDAPQVLSTAGRVVLDAITINPIPSNWGRVTWNGSVIAIR